MAIIYMILILHCTKGKYGKTPPRKTHIKGKVGGKTKCEASSMRGGLQGQPHYIHYHRAYVKQCTICTLGKVEVQKLKRCDCAGSMQI